MRAREKSLQLDIVLTFLQIVSRSIKLSCKMELELTDGTECAYTVSGMRVPYDKMRAHRMGHRIFLYVGVAYYEMETLHIVC